MMAVDLIITELAVFSFEQGFLTLLEVMPGATIEEVRAKTAARFIEKVSAEEAV
jgi:3-oxoacid CoA-transferase